MEMPVVPMLIVPEVEREPSVLAEEAILAARTAGLGAEQILVWRESVGGERSVRM